MRVKSIRSPSRETRIREKSAGAAADVADQHDLAIESSRRERVKLLAIQE